jgi:GNAT superfamily N-acetyltransferase
MKTPAQELSFELYQPHHAADLSALMKLCFADQEASMVSLEAINHLSKRYPKGQIVCLLQGKIVGACLSRVVPYAIYSQAHTQRDCLDTFRFDQDTWFGDSLYGLGVFVDPEYQNLKLGKKLMGMQMQAAFQDNFSGVISSLCLANFPAYMHDMDCVTYLQKVKEGELFDRALSFYLSNGAQFVNASPNFSHSNFASEGQGVVLSIPNPLYNPLRPIYPERAQALRKFEGQQELVSVA